MNKPKLKNQRTVLTIEPNQKVSRKLSEWIIDIGHEPKAVANIEGAKAYIETSFNEKSELTRPVLIFCSTDLGNNNYLKLLYWIRIEKEIGALPVISYFDSEECENPIENTIFTELIKMDREFIEKALDRFAGNQRID